MHCWAGVGNACTLCFLVSQVVQVSLDSIIPYVSGPKRSQDRVAVNNMKSDFQACLNEKVCIVDAASEGISYHAHE